jgi:hypothetical protein
MSSSLLELCNLIADTGAVYAYQHRNLFLEVIKENANRPVSEEQCNAIFKIFSFLNWAYANGIWSNLSDATLRRDLMRQSMQSIVLRTAYELAEDKSNDSVAFLAVRLDQEFKDLVTAYNKRLKELSRDGFESDANTATLLGLELIQENLGLNDEHMNVIVPCFNRRAGDIARIEEIATQVNRADSQRKKGFFSKLFGS